MPGLAAVSLSRSTSQRSLGGGGGTPSHHNMQRSQSRHASTLSAGRAHRDGGVPAEAEALQAVLAMHESLHRVIDALQGFARDAGTVAKLRKATAVAEQARQMPRSGTHQQPPPPTVNMAFALAPGLIHAIGAEARDTLQHNYERLDAMACEAHETARQRVAGVHGGGGGGGGGGMDPVTFLDSAMASVYSVLAGMSADVQRQASGDGMVPIGTVTDTANATSTIPTRVAAPQSNATPPPFAADAELLPPPALRRQDKAPSAAKLQRRASVQSPPRPRADVSGQRSPPPPAVDSATRHREPFAEGDGAATATRESAVPPPSRVTRRASVSPQRRDGLAPVTPPTRGQSPGCGPQRMPPHPAEARRGAETPPPEPKPTARRLSIASTASAQSGGLGAGPVAVKPVAAAETEEDAFERRRSERRLHAEHGSRRRLDILARLERSPDTDGDAPPPSRQQRHPHQHDLPSAGESTSNGSTPTAPAAAGGHAGFQRPNGPDRPDNVTPTDGVATTQHRPAVASGTPPTPLGTVEVGKAGGNVAALFQRHMDEHDGGAHHHRQRRGAPAHPIDLGQPSVPVGFQHSQGDVAVIG